MSQIAAIANGAANDYDVAEMELDLESVYDHEQCQPNGTASDRMQAATVTEEIIASTAEEDGFGLS